MTFPIAITIDVENPQSPWFAGKFSSNLMDPYSDGEAIGVELILQELGRLAIPATFFVNVYEAEHWGAAPLEKLCNRILESGHEVGLHTHPSWKYDPRRELMRDYSYSEQTDILSHGLELLKSWLPKGTSILSHRAGSYGASLETLRALKHLGFKIDSSSFFRHPSCGLSLPSNQPCWVDGMMEFPVTGFERVVKSGFFVKRTFVKTDINSASEWELFQFVESAARQPLSFMNLFLHSYSFMRGARKNWAEVILDREVLGKFTSFLRRCIEDKNCRFVRLSDLFSESPSLFQDSVDFVPTFETKRTVLESLKRKWLTS